MGSQEKRMTSENNINVSESECIYLKKDNYPFGVDFIRGSNKLVEYPEKKYFDRDHSGKKSITELLAESVESKCPRNIRETICINQCCQLKATECINFINGDLIISDDQSCPENDEGDFNGLGHFSRSAYKCELKNIFPNLLGINGSLYIIGTKYKKITGFDKLRYVTGSIIIVNNTNLINIPTFNSLLTVSNYIKSDCSYNPCDSNTSQSNIQCTTGTIVIASNPLLRNIIGFEQLRQVSDGIFILMNSCLSKIGGFTHLYSSDRIIIQCNPKLHAILGFCYIDTVSNALIIANNNIEGQSDMKIDAFLCLESVGRLVVVGNLYLSNVTFGSIKRILKDIVISGNQQLTEINISVESSGNVFIENNSFLGAIIMSDLIEIHGNLNINNNGAITSLNSFEKLKRVSGSVMISDNTLLTEIRGFNELKYIGSRCILRTTADCSSIQGPCPYYPLFVDNMQQASICMTGMQDPSVWIAYWNSTFVFDSNSGCDSQTCSIISFFDPTLYDLESSPPYQLDPSFFKLICNTDNTCRGPKCTPCRPFQEKTQSCCSEGVNGSLFIFQNPRLKAIGAFNALKHMESSLFIVYNNCLHTIQAFSQLCYVLDIWLRNNPSLKYIYGFQNLLSARDIVTLESACLHEFNTLSNIEFAQSIVLEAKVPKALKLHKTTIPSVIGYGLYYSYEKDDK